MGLHDSENMQARPVFTPESIVQAQRDLDILASTAELETIIFYSEEEENTLQLIINKLDAIHGELVNTLIDARVSLNHIKSRNSKLRKMSEGVRA